jgi:ABC-2 type transport system ATP-binding protein
MNIKVNKISKKFNKTTVVKDLSFQVKKGKIVGLLGPNGAGKTTTLRMILGILHPDEGTVTFNDKPINRNIRNLIGYLPEERGLYQKYKVINVLEYFGRLNGLSKKKSHVEAVRLLDRFQMINYLEMPVGHLSKGLQQKLQFLVSLIHDPEVYIMDEPLWGLDPINQEMVREKICSLKEEGKSIIISTHQLVEAEEMCDYFVLIDHGHLILQGTLEQIRKNFHQNIIIVDSHQNPSELEKIPQIEKFEVKNSKAYLYVDNNAPIKNIMQEIIRKVDFYRIEFYNPSLSDIFMKSINTEKK